MRTQAKQHDERKTARPLTAEQIAQFHKDGFVMIRGLFDPEEIEPLRNACIADPGINQTQTTVDDGSEGFYKVSIWTELGDALLGVIPRMARLVDAAEALLGEPCYHWHSKLLRKRPGDGEVAYHQDIATWYEDGCLFPNLLTCTLAVDKNDKENGCLKLVPGSHKMNRIHRIRVGETIDTHRPDPVRVGHAIDKLGVVYAELEPGDVLIFHSQTLHGSEPNHSDRPRTVLHTSYNAVSNAPVQQANQEHHRYKPLVKLSDDTIKNGQYQGIFEGHCFHPPETSEAPGMGVFFRKSDADVDAHHVS